MAIIYETIGGSTEAEMVSTNQPMNRKLPRIPKNDGAKYNTGDAQNWTYEYTTEDLMAVQAITECPSEEMPTHKQIYEYGVLCEMLAKLELELGEFYTEKAKERWGHIVKQLNDV